MTASYEYHIGVDYRKSYSHLVVQDSSGKTLRSGRVKNDRQSLGGFLERYCQNSACGCRGDPQLDGDVPTGSTTFVMMSFSPIR